MSEHSKVSVEALDSFFIDTFGDEGRNIPKTRLVNYGYAEIEMKVSKKDLRPGGFISGPTQMAMADHAAYIAVFTQAGIEPMALTSSLSINFLRPCIGDSIIAKATVLKTGRALSVISVDIFGSASEKISAQVSVSYVLPRA